MRTHKCVACPPQVIDPTYTQMLTQVLPEAAANNNVFVHDHFHTFTTTTFLGIEVSMCVMPCGTGPHALFSQLILHPTVSNISSNLISAGGIITVQHLALAEGQMHCAVTGYLFMKLTLQHALCGCAMSVRLHCHMVQPSSSALMFFLPCPFSPAAATVYLRGLILLGSRHGPAEHSPHSPPHLYSCAGTLLAQSHHGQE